MVCRSDEFGEECSCGFRIFSWLKDHRGGEVVLRLNLLPNCEAGPRAHGAPYGAGFAWKSRNVLTVVFTEPYHTLVAIRYYVTVPSGALVECVG
jgi:hypothetical protein